VASIQKKGRTVRLTPDVDNRLQALCSYLGVNPNAYMIAEIGKAVARDEVSYSATMKSNAIFEEMGALARKQMALPD
jgi:predicted DNA-binding protein